MLAPKSLAGRTILLLLFGFALIQLLGLIIHTFNQMKLERIEDERDMATRAAIIYRHIAWAPPADRAALVGKEVLPRGDRLSLTTTPFGAATYPLPLFPRQIIIGSLISAGIPMAVRPRAVALRGSGLPPRAMTISFALPDYPQEPPHMPLLPPRPDFAGPAGAQRGPPLQPNLGPPLGPPPGPEQGPEQGPQQGPGAFPALNDRMPLAALPAHQLWLALTFNIAPPAPWRSPGFATAFIVMTVLGAIMIVTAVRRLLVPVRTLARAAERLGRDVANAPPLPETGSSELVTAAVAFNTMAARIRRFVEDRTFLLTAIGHDLRTPITRLKLRAEFMEDEEQRTKMLADLDEMEAMVAATLAFGRDIATSESVTRLDLASLLRTILDEAADGDPDHQEALAYAGPDHLAVQARALGLKRALTNLIGNALKYGDAARVRLSQPQDRLVRIDIDDNGPGIDPPQQETVFEPFRRLETSRNRETGGSGLGLSIARNIIRAHGGDILLQNRPGGGLRASVSLPI